MLAVIGAGIQIALLLLTEWFKYKDEKRQKVREILKEVPSAKTASDVTRIFDAINRA